MIFDYKTTRLDELQDMLSRAVAQFIRGLDEVVHIVPIQEFLDYAVDMACEIVTNKVEDIQDSFDRIEENKQHRRKNIPLVNLRELENDE